MWKTWSQVPVQVTGLPVQHSSIICWDFLCKVLPVQITVFAYTFKSLYSHLKWKICHGYNVQATSSFQFIGDKVVKSVWQ